MRSKCLQVGTHFVDYIPVGAHPVAAHDDCVDFAAHHQKSSGIVRNDRMRDTRSSQLAGGQACTLVAGAGLVHPDMHRKPAGVEHVNRCSGRAPGHRRQGPGVAVGEDLQGAPARGIRALRLQEHFDTVAADGLVHPDVGLDDPLHFRPGRVNRSCGVFRGPGSRTKTCLDRTAYPCDCPGEIDRCWSRGEQGRCAGVEQGGRDQGVGCACTGLLNRKCHAKGSHCTDQRCAADLHRGDGMDTCVRIRKAQGMPGKGELRLVPGQSAPIFEPERRLKAWLHGRLRMLGAAVKVKHLGRLSKAKVSVNVSLKAPMALLPRTGATASCLNALRATGLCVHPFYATARRQCRS